MKTLKEKFESTFAGLIENGEVSLEKYSASNVGFRAESIRIRFRDIRLSVSDENGAIYGEILLNEDGKFILLPTLMKRLQFSSSSGDALVVIRDFLYSKWNEIRELISAVEANSYRGNMSELVAQKISASAIEEIRRQIQKKRSKSTHQP